MLAQHSSQTGEWYTPPEWIALAREALGSIDLDPCSSHQANATVRAGRWFTSESDALVTAWSATHTTAFVNPPGACPRELSGFTVCGNAKKCSCNLPRKFLEKSITEAAAGMSIVYLAYSVNQLRQLSSIAIPSGLGVAIALPHKRIAYIDPETMLPQRGTNCDSAFVFLSWKASHRRFAEAFARAGCVTYVMY